MTAAAMLLAWADTLVAAYLLSCGWSLFTDTTRPAWVDLAALPVLCYLYAARYMP